MLSAISVLDKEVTFLFQYLINVLFNGKGNIANSSSLLEQYLW